MNLEQLLGKYERVLSRIPELEFETWGDNHDARHKARNAVTREILDKFADYCIGGIGLESGIDFPSLPPDQRNALQSGELVKRPVSQSEIARLEKQVSGRVETIKNLLSFTGFTFEEKIELLRADGLVRGPLIPVKIRGHKIVATPHTAQVCIRYPILVQLLGHHPRSLMEIGGGHGRFVRDVGRIAPETPVFYCDLPLNMLLAARYLSACFPGEVNLVWEEEDKVDEGKRFNIVAPWRLSELPEGIDVCCNFLSFHHMTDTNINYYTQHLIDRSVAHVFSYNRTFPFHPGEASLPETLLFSEYGETSNIPGSKHYLMQIAPDGRRRRKPYQLYFSLMRRKDITDHKR